MADKQIKGLTLYEPYASLIALGMKRFETRTWGTTYRGLVVIHAGKTLELDWRDARFVTALREAGIEADYKWPLGMAIGVGELVGCWKAESVVPHISEHERLFGNFEAGRVAWEFKAVQRFVQPVPVRGQRYLWDWTGDLPELVPPF